MPDDPHPTEVPGAHRTTRRSLVAGGVAVAGGVLAPLALTGRSASAATTTAGGSTTSVAGPTTTVVQPPRGILDVPGELALVGRARALGYAVVAAYDAVLEDPEGFDAEMVVTLRSFRVGHLDAAHAWAGVAGTSHEEGADAEAATRFRVAVAQARTPEARLLALHQAEELMAGEMMALLGQVQSLEAARSVAGIMSSCARRGVVLATAAGVELSTAIPTFQPLEAEAP